MTEHDSSAPPTAGSPAADPSVNVPVESLVTAVEAAGAAGQLSEAAVTNLKRWLQESGYAAYRPLLARKIEGREFSELESLYWQVLPFGTGGRRGTMAELGSATMNARTVCESASGIAQYLKRARGTSGGRGVIAYDSRHRSREFAELTARTWAAAGLKVFLFEGARSTPELSFAVRHLRCDVGVMISASHNPPADNGVKAYWSTGGQVLPPHDRGIIECVYEANEIPLADLDEARAAGQVEMVGEELDEYYVNAVNGCGLSKARQVTAVYSPLHGVGETSVFRVLAEAGFEGVTLYAPQATQDGEFPKVPQQLPNPERPEVYEPIIEAARKTKADLVLASDPDADRLGVAVRDSRGRYVILSGNRVGALLADYVLRKRKGTGTLGKGSFLVQTLVTTPLIPVIAEKYKVTVFGDLLVGFKYIGQVIDREGAQRFLLGCEESLGYLAGGYARDKDAAVAALLLCECASELKREGKTLLDRLDELYIEHGYHNESQCSETARGAEGLAMVARLLEAFATRPPTELAGVRLKRVRDYRKHEIRQLPENEWLAELPVPSGDLVIFDSVRGEVEISFAVRPSGTEPKIKFYFFAHGKVGTAENLDKVRVHSDKKLAEVEEALVAWVRAVWSEPVQGA